MIVTDNEIAERIAAAIARSNTRASVDGQAAGRGLLVGALEGLLIDLGRRDLLAPADPCFRSEVA